MIARPYEFNVNGLNSLKLLGRYLSIDFVKDGDHLDRAQLLRKLWQRRKISDNLKARDKALVMYKRGNRIVNAFLKGCYFPIAKT